MIGQPCEKATQAPTKPNPNKTQTRNKRTNQSWPTNKRWNKWNGLTLSLPGAKKRWKTPALTTSSAVCRKCQTSIIAQYIEAVKDKFLVETVSQAGAMHPRDVQKHLSTCAYTYPHIPVILRRDKNFNPLQANRLSSKVSKTFHP